LGWFFSSLPFFKPRLKKIFYSYFSRKKRFKKFIRKYRAFLIYRSFRNIFCGTNLYKSTFILSFPKKQQRLSIFRLDAKKDLHFSMGRLLRFAKYRGKFIKKKRTSIMTAILLLKKNYLKYLLNVYLCVIKNFNMRQFYFFMQYLDIFQPSIWFVIHKQSFIPRFTPKRRISRTVVRLINEDWGK
jgi:hypothetical protein